jgi:hypothetical protein
MVGCPTRSSVGLGDQNRSQQNIVKAIGRFSWIPMDDGGTADQTKDGRNISDVDTSPVTGDVGSQHVVLAGFWFVLYY